MSARLSKVLNFDQAPLSFLEDFESPIKLLCGNEASLHFIRAVVHSAARYKKAS